MILLYCVILVLGYALAAAWAVRPGGGGRLWGVATGMLGLLVLGGVLLGYGFAVPSIPRLLLYLLALSAPAVLLPTLLLWAQRGRPRAQAAAVPIALAGGVVGLGERGGGRRGQGPERGRGAGDRHGPGRGLPAGDGAHGDPDVRDGGGRPAEAHGR